MSYLFRGISRKHARRRVAIAAFRFWSEANLDPLETKCVSYIYDGSVARFHEWEFRTMARIEGVGELAEDGTTTTKPENLRKNVNRVIEGLRGDALDLAMDIGRARLMTEDGVPLLVDAIRKKRSFLSRRKKLRSSLRWDRSRTGL